MDNCKVSLLTIIHLFYFFIPVFQKIYAEEYLSPSYKMLVIFFPISFLHPYPQGIQAKNKKFYNLCHTAKNRKLFKEIGRKEK